MKYFYTIGLILALAMIGWAHGAAKGQAQAAADSSGIQTSLHNNQVHIYPNPVVKEVHITIEQPSDKKYEVYVLDALGQKLDLLMHTSTTAGRQTYTFQMQDQPKGVYFIRITTENYQAVKTYKVLKSK